MLPISVYILNIDLVTLIALDICMTLVKARETMIHFLKILGKNPLFFSYQN